jgi:hypothetical protein
MVDEDGNIFNLPRYDRLVERITGYLIMEYGIALNEKGRETLKRDLKGLDEATGWKREDIRKMTVPRLAGEFYHLRKGRLEGQLLFSQDYLDRQIGRYD